MHTTNIVHIFMAHTVLAYLIYACFVPGYFLNGIAQEMGVIQIEAGGSAYHWGPEKATPSLNNILHLMISSKRPITHRNQLCHLHVQTLWCSTFVAVALTHIWTHFVNIDHTLIILNYICFTRQCRNCARRFSTLVQHNSSHIWHILTL